MQFVIYIKLGRISYQFGGNLFVIVRKKSYDETNVSCDFSPRARMAHDTGFL